MTAQPNESLPERPSYLALLAASPAIWAAHFLLSYCTAAVWCEKVAAAGGTLGAAGVAIWILTALALAAIAAIAWHAGADIATAMPSCRTISARPRIATVSWASPACCSRA